MKIKELRELTIEELGTKRRELKHEMLNLRIQQQSGQLENPARIYLLRKDVSRIETIISERSASGKAAAPSRWSRCWQWPASRPSTGFGH